ncbi:MAG: hypothetical protein P8N56_04895 [Schleiferiaceae bacterium]|nr:hypothetical protein [Schleiferiaceae bacterium]
MRSQGFLMTWFVSLSFPLLAQWTFQPNTANQLLQASGTLSIRGYGECIGNQPFGAQGTWDARRLVLFTGYKYDANTAVVTEIEVEHATEIYLEQAFVQHRLHPGVNFRAGLMLIPMGIANEYHEPTTFHGSERPYLDHVVVPSTWRELGAGFQGFLPRYTMGYQAYVVNGLRSYDGQNALFNAENGLRSGRQKGRQTLAAHPSFTGKLEWAGLKNTIVSASYFVGQTESPEYNPKASGMDSTTVFLQMTSFDLRWARRRIHFRAQATFAHLGNAEAYRIRTVSTVSTWIGGGYGEASVQLLPERSSYACWAFSRYSYVQTGAQPVLLWTQGISFFLHSGVVLKADIQQRRMPDYVNWTANAGLGFWF